jgi:hydrogenase maturation protease
MHLTMVRETVAIGNGALRMQTDVAATRTLVLGLGNTLRSDDGVGVHVVQALTELETGRHVTLRDGGTIGLALLSDIEESAALIAIDAAELGAEPGTVRVFSGSDMDNQLHGKKRTAHEVALADLIAAARLSGRKPLRCALVAIQPGSTEWGLTPTEPIRSAIPAACSAVLSLVEDWNDES